MKNSLIILLCFVLGVLSGKFEILPLFLANDLYSLWVLYALVFFVGIGIGCNPHHFDILRKDPLRILLVPCATIIGTLGGAALISIFFQKYGIIESASVGAGFGYYSLSCFELTRLHSPELGVIALLANIIRELLTLILAPLIVYLFGPIGLISSGGATSMDTTLPIITKYSGKDFAMISVFHGVVLSILVPVIINLLFIFY
jgi:uncharacterized membrane protein YbjE (DUF340 family)